MKILLIHHFPGVGGGTISALDLARMLKMLSHEVTMAVPSPCQMIVDNCRENGITLCSVKRPPLFTYHNASSSSIRCAVKYVLSLRSKRYWKNFFVENKPELVIFNSSPMATLAATLNKMNIPCICCVRETFRLHGNKMANTILRKMIGRCDMALYLTEYDRKCWNTKNTLQGVMPDVVDENRYKMNDSAAIELFRKEKELRDNTKYILYLGGISRPKGSLGLLKAFRRVSLNNKNIGLLLLGNTYQDQVLGRKFCLTHRGEASYIKECRDIIEDLKQKFVPIVEVGIVNDTSLWYEASDAVVFPVELVHQPRPAYEAGHYGKPIVLPKLENFMEYVTDGENGFMYEKNDINDLAEKLIKSVEEGNGVKAGRANQKKCQETHSFEVGMKILEKSIDMLKS